MNAWVSPAWTQGNGDERREQMECPNCGGTDDQTDDDDGHRICWKCGTRWST